MKYLKLVIGIVSVLLISSSGCIDVYLVKEYFQGKEGGRQEYAWREKDLTLNYRSESNETAFENQSLGLIVTANYVDEDYSFEIAQKTKQLKVTFNISFDVDLSQLGEIIPLPEQILQSILPYVEVTILNPSKHEVYSKMFTNDTEESFSYKDPKHGEWHIEFTTKDYHLSFDVYEQDFKGYHSERVEAYEPK